MTEKKKDVMDNILTGSDEEFADKTQDLDCLIYRSGDKNTQDQPGKTKPSFKITRGDVSVEIWEGKAKIRVKVLSGDARSISMKKIANIAVDAIIKELKKEGS